MKKWKSQIAAILLVTIGFYYCEVTEALEKTTTSNKVLMCYVDKWAEKRMTWKFTIANIHPSVCTHLAYGNDIADDNLRNRKFNEIKALNPKLKTLLSVGDIFNANYKTFRNTTFDQEARRAFVVKTALFLRTNKFDGLDLVWNTPNIDELGSKNPGKTSDDTYLGLLLKELRLYFDFEKNTTEGKTVTKKDRLLLTVAVAADYIGGYNVSKINKHVDYISLINFMSLDGFHGVVDETGYTKFTAGLNTLATTTKAWIAAGASREKILLGLPLFGRAFTLADPSNNRPNAGAKGRASVGGTVFSERRTIGFYQTCFFCDETAVSCEFDPEAKSPFAYQNGLWVSFEDSYSLQFKMMWMKNMGLAGATVWSMDTDDFDNTCGKGRYPLLTLINECLLNDQNCAPVNVKHYPLVKASESSSGDSAVAPNPIITTVIAVAAVFLLKFTFFF